MFVFSMSELKSNLAYAQSASTAPSLAAFRLEYEDEYEVTVLGMRSRLAGRKFSKCACSVL